MAYGKYRIDPAYLNQFRNVAYNDPWFALGELVGKGAAAAYDRRQYQKQLEKAGRIDAQTAQEAYQDAANQKAQESGLIGTSTYDGITKAKADYGTHKATYDDTMAKINAFTGDQKSQEYLGLLEMAKQAQEGMQTAQNRAEQLRQINRDNGWSNEGYYATDSLSEKLGDRSLYAPQEQVKPSLLGGVLPTQEKQMGTFTAPTITEMAQRSLDVLQQNPMGKLSAEDVARYHMTNPELKASIVNDYDRSKRNATYFSDLEQKMKKEGISQEVIDEYLGGKKRAVVEDMLGDYYQAVLKGNLYGADALSTLMAGIDPTTAQILKTGGVSIGNLFGAEMQQKLEEAEAARKAAEKAETRDYNERKRQQEREERIEDAVKIAQLKKSLGLSGDSGGSSGGGKASSEETYTNNLILSALDALAIGKVDEAENFMFMASNNLNDDNTTAKKISPDARNKFRQMLKDLGDDIADAKNNASVD